MFFFSLSNERVENCSLVVVAKAKVPAAANRKKSEKNILNLFVYVTCYAMLLYAMMLCYILFYFFLIAPHPHQPHQKKEPMDLGLGMTRVREKIAQFLLQLLLASAAHYCSVEQNYVALLDWFFATIDHTDS